MNEEKFTKIIISDKRGTREIYQNTKTKKIIKKPNYKQSYNQRKKNEVFELAWRILALLLIIDLPLWGYFHFVKNETFLQGIQNITSSRKTNTNYQLVNTYHKKPVSKNEYKHWKEYQKLKNEKNFENITEEAKWAGKYLHASDKEKIYCWEDYNGKTHYSNIGFPAGQYKPKWIRQYSKN